jgi:hypothetical protein
MTSMTGLSDNHAAYAAHLQVQTPRKCSPHLEQYQALRFNTTDLARYSPQQRQPKHQQHHELMPLSPLKPALCLGQIRQYRHGVRPQCP